ncbi:MAG: DJ-1/PfpI family protein [Capsulimonadaceae bacterium]|nr:DJ-1/PfpI family protein [Capsulimonadaceae bacterium]
MNRVGIIVYDGADELEISASVEILTSIRTLENGKWTNDPVFDVQLVGASKHPVLSSHGMGIVPGAELAETKGLDIIVLPGGPGARLQKYPDALAPWLKSEMPRAKYVLSLTTGAFILARAGLLKGRRLATYKAFVADIKRIEPSANVTGDERIVFDGGTLISTSGISVAVEACLALVERMEGFRSAEIAAKRIGWPEIIDDFVPLYTT